MNIKDFKRLGLRMLLNSALTSFFITTFCILMASFTQIDFSSLISIDYTNLTTANLLDQLVTALTHSLNSNIFTGILALDPTNFTDIVGLALFSLVFFIAVYSVLTVGRDAYFLQARAMLLDSNLLMYGYDKKIYRKVMYAQLVRYATIFLGSILIIPGIYYSYKYRFLNYVIAQYPDKEIKEWYTINNKMTDGRIWFLITMDLSFVGWRLLNLVTFNLFKYILEPYYQSTYCELYVATHQAIYKNNGYGHNPRIKLSDGLNKELKKQRKTT